MASNRQRFLFLFTPLVVVAAYCVAVVGASATKLRLFLNLANWYAKPIGVMWISLGIAMLIVSIGREAFNPNRKPIADYFTRLLIVARRPSSQISAITPPLAFTLLMAAYSTFKQTTLPHSGYWADAAIASMEYKLLLGHHAWQITHGLLAVEAGYWLDQAYQIWFPLMVGSMLVCSYLSGDPLHRCRFILCFAATWIITGTALAYLIPASGPIYYGHFHALPDPFLPLKAILATDDAALKAVHGSGLLAIRGHAWLLQAQETGTIIPGGGISAMPSMHNAIAILLACAGYSVTRWLGWLLTLFAGLIFVGSIHLGWHFALDGIVAGAVSGGLWVSSNRLIARHERRIGNRRLRATGGRRAADRHWTTPMTSIPEPVDT